MYGVILAGGSGTRFWPLSREEYPKQLLKIFGDKTLIQVTVSRISALIPPERCSVVTNAQQMEQIRFQLAQTASGELVYITEPARKDTAAAIGLAAITLRHRDPDAVMAVLSADHFMKDENRFLEMLKMAEKVAKQGHLVTLGAKPRRPETAYGYIESGEALSSFSGVFDVARFVEKPNRDVAVSYLQNPAMFWNTGIFVWQVSSILEEIERFLPELYQGLQEIEMAMGHPDYEKKLSKIYDDLQTISIDYGVLEKSDRLAVLETDMGWEDVGSWNALDEVLTPDASGNIVSGNVVNVGSINTTIYAGERVVAVVGLKDIVVADTEDATLVCSKDAAQDVKKVVAVLKKRGRTSCSSHRYPGLGQFTVLEEGPGYKIKKIEVNPGSKLSLQMHHKRSEHWIVVEGVATVTCGESVYSIPANQSTFVPMGVKHRLENATSSPLRLVEVQNGHYLGEDDYGRVPLKS